MTRIRARQLATWIKQNYEEKLRTELGGTPFSLAVAYAIACKETGIYLLEFIEELPAQTALARCVFDASGDAVGTSRRAYPRNTDAFRREYGDEFSDMLIKEANKSRALRGLDATRWIYKGYGIFQYDLQHVRTDEAFFRDKRWYDFDECAKRLKQELMRKYATTGNVMDAIQTYNGSGPKAVVYRSHVEQLMEFVRDI